MLLSDAAYTGAARPMAPIESADGGYVGLLPATKIHQRSGPETLGESGRS